MGGSDVVQRWSPQQATHLPLRWIFYLSWHIPQIEGTSGIYCILRKTQAKWGGGEGGG